MRKVQRSLLALALLAPFVVGAPPPAQAQSWPQRAVRILLPLPPGSGTDLAARLLAERLTVRAVVGGALILLGVYLTERETGGIDSLGH